MAKLKPPVTVVFELFPLFLNDQFWIPEHVKVAARGNQVV